MYDYVPGAAPIYRITDSRGNRAYGFDAHPGQQAVIDFMKDRNGPTTMYASMPAQGGKSSLCPWILRYEMAMKGPGRQIVVAPDSTLIFAGIQKPLLSFFRDELDICESIGFNSQKALTIINFKGSFIDAIARSSGQPRVETQLVFRHTKYAGSLQGHDAKCIIFDEAAAKSVDPEVFLELDDRASTHNAKRYYFSTPLHLGTFTENWNKYKDNHNPLVRTCNVPRWLNPTHKPPNEYKGLTYKEYCETIIKPKIPKHEYERRYLGLPTKSEGVVIDQFSNKNIFIYTPQEKHRRLERIAGYDGGTSNIGGVLALYDRKNYILRIIDEYNYNRHKEGHERFTPQHHVKKMLSWDINRMCFGLADHDKGSMYIFDAVGIQCVNTKIRDVNTQFKIINDLLDREKLIIDSNCYVLIQSLNTIAEDPKTGKVDLSNHHVFDALRYLVGTLWNPYWKEEVEYVEVEPDIRPELTRLREGDDPYKDRPWMRPLNPGAYRYYK